MNIYPVGILLAQIKQLQNRIIERKLKETKNLDDLNGPQINILYHLWQEDDICISELSNRTNLANTTLTTMLERLERQGHITRCRNEKNKRETRIRLTSKAKELQINSSLLLTDMHSINFKGFTQEEQLLLYDLLNRMKKNLEYEDDTNGNN